MFIVIHPDGTVVTEVRAATADAIRCHVGEPGFDMFPANADRSLYAFVNDEGFYDQAKHPRNVYGGAVIAALGGGIRLLAGVVVITGWRPHTEISDLSQNDVWVIETIHAEVTRALAGEPLRSLAYGGWAETVCDYAQQVRTAATPKLEVVPLQIDPGALMDFVECPRCDHQAADVHDGHGCKLSCPCPLTPANIAGLLRLRGVR